MTITRIGWHTRSWRQSRLGPANPLPHFRGQQPIKFKPTPENRGLNVEESAHGFAWGEDSILPYRVQDEYDRTQMLGDFPIVIIDNGRLRLEIAPQLGGRLLRLYDYQRRRDLIFNNPVFQPANLGALNAWFSGGIEWNGLIPGHTAFTCSSVFCGIVNTSRGEVLRLYEFDRIVEATWQIDLFLPSGDDRLFVHGCIVNPDEVEKKAYWWTNIAVPHSPGMRVLSPADYSIEHILPGNQLERFPFPDASRFDGSYPDRWLDSTSVFFRPQELNTRRTLCALDKGGCGLGHVATREMKGRKFFYFGTGSGGQQWMDFLSLPGQGNYVEIQSGVTPTQNQRFTLGSRDEFHWTEAYAGIEVATALAHDTNYTKAVAGTQAVLAVRIPEDELQEIGAFLRDASHLPVAERLHDGSAWGARQERILGRPLAQGLDFSSSEAHVTIWDELLDAGTFSAESGAKAPEEFALSPRWVEQVEASSKIHGETALHNVLLSVAAQDAGNLAKARALLEKVFDRPECEFAGFAALAYRQLALLEDSAVAQEAAFLEAWQQVDPPAVLAIEIVTFLAQQKRFDTLSRFVKNLPHSVRQAERIRLAEAELAAERHDWPGLASLLQYPFATIREGETLLDSLWWKLQKGLCAQSLARSQEQIDETTWLNWQKAYPVPKHLDFRMQGAA